MIIYKDAISGDELFSDTYKMKVVDDTFYEVEGKLTTEKTEVTDSMFGGNASAEGGGDDVAEDQGKSGCNIVLANRLQEMEYDKAGFMDYIKGYMKRLQQHIKTTNPDREAQFKAGAQASLKKIRESFKDWQFFLGESGIDGGGMLAFLNFREDGITPYMLFFKDGVIEEKV